MVPEGESEPTKLREVGPPSKHAAYGGTSEELRAARHTELDLLSELLRDRTQSEEAKKSLKQEIQRQQAELDLAHEELALAQSQLRGGARGRLRAVSRAEEAGCHDREDFGAGAADPGTARRAGAVAGAAEGSTGGWS